MSAQGGQVGVHSSGRVEKFRVRDFGRVEVGVDCRSLVRRLFERVTETSTTDVISCVGEI